MERIVTAHPECGEVIFPYIGGEEVNTSPTHSHHRYVIDFGERSEGVCRRRWPELMAIVETKVKPERQALNDRNAREKWWQFLRPRPELHGAIAGLERVLVHPFLSQHLQFAFLPSGMVYAGPTNVFPLPTSSAFCALQARPHEIWARFFTSSMKDDLRYTPSDCFETCPFPEKWESAPALEAAGKDYYDFRAALMVQKHLVLRQDGISLQGPSEEIACDEFAGNMLMERVASYAASANLPLALLHRKRAMAVALASFFLLSITPSHVWSGTASHPALRCRLEALTKTIDPNGDEDAWIFLCCLVASLLRRERRMPAQIPFDSARSLGLALIAAV